MEIRLPLLDKSCPRDPLVFRLTKDLNPKAVSILGVPEFFRDSQHARDVMLFVWLVLSMLLQLSQESLNSSGLKSF